MNEIGIALLWCSVQVTVIGLIAVALYYLTRRWAPSAAALTVPATLVLVVALSALAFVPWPGWYEWPIASRADRNDSVDAGDSASPQPEARLKKTKSSVIY